MANEQAKQVAERTKQAEQSEYRKSMKESRAPYDVLGGPEPVGSPHYAVEGLKSVVAERMKKQGEEASGLHNPDSHGKRTGVAHAMGPWGPDESTQKYGNMPFRDLHEGGHDLNHSYKNPVAAVSPDVAKAGTNHSYHHPLVNPAKENSPLSQARGNRIVPVNQTGKGKQ